IDFGRLLGSAQKAMMPYFTFSSENIFNIRYFTGFIASEFLFDDVKVRRVKANANAVTAWRVTMGVAFTVGTNQLFLTAHFNGGQFDLRIAFSAFSRPAITH